MTKGLTVREFTAINNQVVEIDTSEEACQRFGFSPDQKVVDVYGRPCTVVGVAPLSPIPGEEDPPCIEPSSDMLWVSLDINGGKVCSIPDPENNLRAR